MIALGADRRDLSLISRFASYESAFELLYMLDDPCVDNDDNKMLHESLLGADPSGLEGRPGSAGQGRLTWFFRRVATPSLESRLVCHVDRLGYVF